MGFRTVVMLNNDRSDVWSKDPELGQKIQYAMNFAGSRDLERRREARLDSYGVVVECVHADTQTLAIIDRYSNFEPISYGFRNYGPETLESRVALLKRAADEMGYRLVAKPKNKG